jgi:hypothetical protein
VGSFDHAVLPMPPVGCPFEIYHCAMVLITRSP